MPKYQTRHMEALREFPFGRRPLVAGDRFTTEPVNADYLVSRRMAKDVPAPAEKPRGASTPAPPPAASAARRQPTSAPTPASAPAPASRPAPPTAPAGVTTLADLDPARAAEAKPGATTADDK